MPDIKERPVIFSAPMITAILSGQKTQTRRIITPAPPKITSALVHIGGRTWACIGNNGPNRDCRYGAVGDRLWVKERWTVYREKTPEEDAEVMAARDAFFANPSLEGIREFALKCRPGTGPEKFMYAADFGEWADNPDSDLHWTSPRYIPKRAARIHLEITEVRAQKIQFITEDDILAEGLTHGIYLTPEKRIKYFARHWDVINGKRRGCKWRSNPWVWAISFKLLKPPAPST